MGSKISPGKFDCYANALPDEPMFVLLARDPHAPTLLLDWAARRSQDIRAGVRPESDWRRVNEALSCANDMRIWRASNEGKWRTEGEAM